MQTQGERASPNTARVEDMAFTFEGDRRYPALPLG